MKKILSFISAHKQTLILFFVIAFSCFFHAKNMLHYPFFENDEGTYMAQAYSVVYEGKLSPYTYWYDHAPFGWIFFSAWMLLTGGVFGFGFSLNSARIAMLIIQVINTVLLLRISRKITRSELASLLACILFSLSPLAVYFHRRLLLDNLMTFWILLSFHTVLYMGSKLRGSILAALYFALAVLTKENAIFFLPTLVWYTAAFSHEKHKKIAVVFSIVIACAMISVYPFYALLKGELFPAGSIFSAAGQHVSLLTTLAMHGSRGSGLPFYTVGSDFFMGMKYWVLQDPLLIGLGFVTFGLHAILGFFLRQRQSALIAALTFPMLIFLMSGKLVISFYVIPLLPFFALCIGYGVALISQRLAHIWQGFSLLIVLGLIAGLAFYYHPRITEYMTRDETTAQKEMVSWIQKNVDPQSHMSIDFYSYLELAKARFRSDKVFPHADWFWKVELDPDIRDKKLAGDPKKLDYIMITAEVQRQLKGFPEQTSLIRQALANSVRVQTFADEENFHFTLDLVNQDFPNGDWVVLYRQIQFDLQKNWDTYKADFIDPEGYVRSSTVPLETVSEAQSYALIRAVWMNDKETFDRVFDWTQSHMKLTRSSLFGWKWEHKSKKLVDQGNAPDADEEIALALLFASKQFNQPLYKERALAILSDIWKYNVYIDPQGDPYLLAGNWADHGSFVTLNPSYFMPYAYRIFAQADPEHNWNRMVDSSYLALDGCSKSKLDASWSEYLPPEWCRLEKKTGEFHASVWPQPEDSTYGYNAFRIPWRVYLDYTWFQESRAKEYLEKMTFFSRTLGETGKLVDAYTHDGDEATQADGYAYMMNYPSIRLSDEEVAGKLITEKILPLYSPQSGMWKDGKEYYLQNWGWFSMGLYTNQLPNLWNQEVRSP